MTVAATLSPTISAGELTPGAYLRLRREAASLTIDDVALLYTGSASTRAAAALLIGDYEADRAIALEPSLHRLRDCFVLDTSIYYSLVDDVPFSPLCRSCGATWIDGCGLSDRAACLWVDGAAS